MPRYILYLILMVGCLAPPSHAIAVVNPEHFLKRSVIPWNRETHNANGFADSPVDDFITSDNSWCVACPNTLVPGATGAIFRSRKQSSETNRFPRPGHMGLMITGILAIAAISVHRNKPL